MGETSRSTNISVDLCAACRSVEDSGNTIDVGRCYGCARYACYCWLAFVEVEGDKGDYLWCDADVPGGCVKTSQCETCSGSGGDCTACDGEGRIEVQT